MNTLHPRHIAILGAFLLSGFGVLTYTVHAGPLISVSASAVPNVVSETETTTTLIFEPETNLNNSYAIHLEFPEEYSSTELAALTTGDMSVSGTNVTGFSVTAPNSGLDGLLVIDLTTSGVTSGSITITFGDTAGPKADLTNPSSPGLYGINVSTYDASDALIDNGVAFIEIDDTVPVSASVTESLLMTISNSALAYTLDPGVGDGQDKTQLTTITVNTNAVDGYSILGKLDDGFGLAALTSGAHSILSNDFASATNNENYFGYTARNDGTGSNNNAEQGFNNIATTLTADGINPLGWSSATASQDHTIRYDLNIDYLQAPGTYNGTITYTVSASF